MGELAQRREGEGLTYTVTAPMTARTMTIKKSNHNRHCAGRLLDDGDATRLWLQRQANRA